ncbi:MAG: PD40 domain-containing protein, partial [Deinococcales bacterium]|nr:PD40 domain-containing protein [Chitinophagaceae bacterium]
MKRVLFIFLLVAVGYLNTYAQSSPSWLRYSTISPDGKTIVFTYKGDLYKVPATGGSAMPLTFHEAHDFMPVFSNDGKTIAFASDRFGNFDIFTIPLDGGQAKRLTYHSVNEYPYEFSNDDKSVLFGGVRMDVASNRTFPTGSQPELYKVPIVGGKVTQLLGMPAEEVKLSKDGLKLIYQDKKGGENVWRKHHTSAIARDIWVWDMQANTHKKITSFNGEDRTPIFTDNEKAMYYLSEESGSFNIHKIALENTAQSQQITTFKKHPVRFLSSSNDGVLCFGYDGDIYTLKANGKPEKVAITIAVDNKSNNDKVVPVTGGARDMAVSPNGKEVAFIFRGEVFVNSVEGGITKRITNTPEQERNVSFSPDGKTLLYASERDNAWEILETKKLKDDEPYFYVATLLNETPIISNEKENYQPSYSPDGKEIAFIENRMTLKIYNKASKQTRTILTDNELFSMRDNDQYFQWSPDGKWMLFDYSLPGIASGEVGLVATNGKGKVTNITESGFGDDRAKWIMGGKAMIWQSNRDGLKSVAQSGNRQTDIYAMFFTQDAFDKFKLSKEDASLLKEMDDIKNKVDTTKKVPKKDTISNVTFDWEGLTQR